MNIKISKHKNSKKNIDYKLWSYGTLNIRTGKENDGGAKIYSVAKKMSTDMQFLVLQEVRWRGTGNKLIELDTGEEFEFHWRGYNRKRKAGVGILIRSNKNIQIENPDNNDPRVMVINLKVHGFNVRVVNVYSPTDCDGVDEQKQKFYSDIYKASKTSQNHQQLIIASDCYHRIC